MRGLLACGHARELLVAVRVEDADVLRHLVGDDDDEPSIRRGFDIVGAGLGGEATAQLPRRGVAELDRGRVIAGETDHRVAGRGAHRRRQAIGILIRQRGAPVRRAGDIVGTDGIGGGRAHGHLTDHSPANR